MSMMTLKSATRKRFSSSPGMHSKWLSIVCFVFVMLGKQHTFVVGQSCIDNLQEIYDKESIVTDTTFPRTYIICPRTIYEMATYDFKGDMIEDPILTDVNPPLPLRSNMTIRCGDLGSRDSLCWLAGGDLHMDGTKYMGITDDMLDNVVIEGFVFIGSREHSLWADKPGTITFRDCEWRDFVSSHVPILLDYYDAKDSSSQLITTFNDCEFKNNRYFGMGSQTSLIYANSDQNVVNIEKSLFQYNDMIWNNTRPDTHSFLVESLGPLKIENTCFQDNLVGASDVVVFGTTLSSSSNFVSNTSGTLCPFSAVFEDLQQFDNFSPLCVEATMNDCARYITDSPSIAPTDAPTLSPTTAAPTTTVMPSHAPTGDPTISPQPTTTPYPTELPSALPSLSPSEPGDTASPTMPPFDFSWLDTEAPTAGAVSIRQSALLGGISLIWGMVFSCWVATLL